MPNRLLNLILVYIIPFTFLVKSYGQVNISEYSASNLNQFYDNYLKYEDWIELHNSSSDIIDISGYGLSDKKSKPNKWTFPHGTLIYPNERKIIWCSGRDEVVNHNYHSNFKLSQTKGNEFIVLSLPDGSIIENFELEITLLGHSKIKDRQGEWMVNTTPNPGKPDDFNGVYKKYTAQPTIVIEPGFYESPVTVLINNQEPNSTLKYTLDGTLPTDSSKIYTGSIEINHTTVIKTRAFSNESDILPGKICFGTYFINETFTLPVFSIAADQLQDLANGNGKLRPIGSIEYFVDQELSSSSYGELNRHGQDSWINPQRSLDWVSRDEMGYSKSLDEKLFKYSNRDEYQRFMLRASGDDNYPAIKDEDHEGSTHIRDEYVHTLAQQGGMKLDLRAVSRAIVFLNGDYWGLYSPRERPVDHDYTEYNYDQDKYDLQYIQTWRRTWAEYGGQTAVDDWAEIRDFILRHDMSDPDNYQQVKDQMQVLSLIDYIIVNLNSVCTDWMNFNTAWWRGTSLEGKHKKWGYVLWDNDATFDYYKNFSGVPNVNPDARPCDIENISTHMDLILGNVTGGFDLDSIAVSMCNTVLNGTCPYPAGDPVARKVMEDNFDCCEISWDEDCEEKYKEFLAQQNEPVIFEECNSITNGSLYLPEDSIYQVVTQLDNYCCHVAWDAACQANYNLAASGVNIDPKRHEKWFGNIGRHEKIFLKLLEENPTFRQLYFSRQADMMNTAWSCKTMLNTLDKMVAVIEPEMERHIARWGGSKEEWESNIGELRNYISQRCDLLDDGMLECYEVTGPYELTLDVYPEDAGDIDLNTIEIKSFPWSGDYFGGMENLIDADPGSDYNFVRWESKRGHVIFPSDDQENARLTLTGSDTLVAIFELESIKTKTDHFEEATIAFKVFPSPTDQFINISYQLDEASLMKIQIYNAYGINIYSFPAEFTANQEMQTKTLDMTKFNFATGTYFVKIETKSGNAYRKVIVVQ